MLGFFSWSFRFYLWLFLARLHFSEDRRGVETSGEKTEESSQKAGRRRGDGGGQQWGADSGRRVC